jgi:hypothetical protein
MIENIYKLARNGFAVIATDGDGDSMILFREKKLF